MRRSGNHLCLIAVALVLFESVSADLMPDAVEAHVSSSTTPSVLVLWDEGRIETVMSSGLTGETRIPVGSISKVMTAMLAIDAVETGLIDLDQPTITYLGDGWPEVTTRQLLLHTAGLEQRGFETAVSDPAGLVSLERWLRSPNVLQSIAPVDAMTIYSSVGVTLVGRILEAVHGRPYDALAEEFMASLGMEDSGFLPTGRLLEFGTGYPPYNTLIPPAGNLYTTTDDAGALIDQLMSGRFQHLMKPAFSNTDSSHGRTLGMVTRTHNTTAVVYHDGGAPGVNSRVMMVPAQGKAFFYAYASNRYGDKGHVTDLLLSAWLGEQTLPLGKPAAHDVASDFAGSYVPLANSTQTIEWLASLFGQIKVSAEPERLIIAGKPYPHREGDHYFREDSAVPASFATIDGERYLFLGNSSYRQRDGLWAMPALHLAMLLLFAVTPVVMIVRRFRHASASMQSSALRQLSLANSLLALLLLGLVAFAVSRILGDFWLIAWGMPLAWMQYGFFLLIGGALLQAGLAIGERRWGVLVAAIIYLVGCAWLRGSAFVVIKEDRMIVRIFRAVIRQGRVDEFRRMVQEQSIPWLKDSDGMLGYFAGQPFGDNNREFSMVTLWRDLEALKAFCGEDWDNPVVTPDEVPLVEAMYADHYLRFDEDGSDTL